MLASSINATTFKLFKKGTTTPLAATISYSSVRAGQAAQATLNPGNLLQRGVTYKAVVTTGAKDMAGNPLDQDANVGGLQQKAWYFTVSN
jgi:hypothetical protein